MRFALLQISCAAVLATGVAAAAVHAQTLNQEALAATAMVPSYVAANAALAPVANSSSSADAELPEAPAVADEGQAGTSSLPKPQPVAPKYAGTILPGQGAVPLSGGDKVAFALRDAVSPISFASILISATWSQGIDSQPHYGDYWGKPYAQRIGAAAARSTVQTLATEAVFAPIFRDDPRYYVLGDQHKFIQRALYAASRVVVTRTDSGHNTLNAPLLLGYASAAGVNMAYYPERDRDFKDSAIGYAGSLGGAAIGMEVSEFIGDALRITHLRRR